MMICRSEFDESIGRARAADIGDVDYLDVEDRFDRLPSLRWSEFERFLKGGVPARALVYPELPARARVVLFRDRPLFDFAEDVGDEGVVPAFVFLARSEFGDVFDLVAWAPGEARVAAWLGRASMLGLDQLWQPRLMHEGALPVCETPLEWLRAERRAVIILDPTRARWSLYRTNLIVTDVAFGCRVREALRWPAPQIFVYEQI